MVRQAYAIDSGEGHAPSYRERKPHIWSGFYHDNYALGVSALELMPFVLWNNARIDLGILDGMRSLKRNQSVLWDSTKTSILNAVIALSADSDSFLGSALMVVYLNGNVIDSNQWALNGSYIKRIDVLPMLYNGANTFEVTYEKNPVINPSATLIVSATLEVEFAGETPSGGLPDWLPYALIGAGVAVIGGTILFKKKGRRG